jgi:hypothetical protein
MTDEIEPLDATLLPSARKQHVTTYMRRAAPDAPVTQIERKLTVTRRVRAAIEAMVWHGAKRAEAATAAKLTDHSLRAALRRPHVKAHYFQELENLKNSERPRSIHALVDVRDTAKNSMARVSASKTLEELSGGGAANRVKVSVGIYVRAGYILDLSERHEPPQRPQINVIDGQAESQ